MTFKELLTKHNVTQAYIIREYQIPRRTVQDWHSEKNKCAEYLISLLDESLSLKTK